MYEIITGCSFTINFLKVKLLTDLLKFPTLLKFPLSNFRLTKAYSFRYNINMNFGDKNLMFYGILDRRVKSLSYSVSLANFALLQMKNLQFTPPPPPPFILSFK
jgi:hypothetical protein